MKPSSLRAELTRLVAAAVIPIILFSIAVALWDVLNTRRAVERGLEDTARALSLALDREIASWMGALNALSTSRALDSGDLREFSRQAREVAALYGGWITMTEPGGRQVINTSAPPGTALPPAKGNYSARVFETGKPVVSDLFFGALVGEPVLAVYVPVRRAGAVRYSLNLGVAPDRLSALLARQDLSPSWLAMVTDSGSRIIARGKDTSHVGRQAPDWYAEGVTGAKSGLLAGGALEGPVTLAFQRVPDSDWTVAVAVPRAALAAAWLKPLLTMLVAGSVLVGLAIVLSFRYARRIRESVVGLLSGEGHDPHPIREIEDVRQRLREQAEEQTRRREAEAAAASAEEANRSKERFLATLSHELRTPLSAIVGWIAVIRTRGAERGKTEQALAVIERNAIQQAKLIDDLLDISRSIAGKLRVERAPMNLSDAVGEAIDAIRPSAQAKRVALSAAVQPGLRVDGDYGRLMQVANNLLVNAVKFTPQGGRIDVALRRRDGSAELVVRDTGHGIDPALRSRLFERFAQGEVEPSGYQPGLGLGLPIVRHLTELHGGSVTVASEGIGLGATFRVSLPALPEGAVQPAGQSKLPAQAAELSGLRVLVVDDHDDSRQWLSNVLAARGAVIAEATYAGEALAVGERFAPTVVVSDIAMPRGDGYELIRGLRKREDGRRTPAIALTALAGGEDRTRALQEGFDAVVAKGSDPAVLLGVIGRLAFSAPRAAT